MTMMLVERAHNDSGLFGWFTFERKNWIALVLLAGVGGFILGNGHTTVSFAEQAQAQIAHKDAQLHTALNVAGCQQKRADIAEDVARDAAATGIIAGDTVNCPPVSVVAKVPPPKVPVFAK